MNKTQNNIKRTIAAILSFIMILSLLFLLCSCMPEEKADSLGLIGISMPCKSTERWNSDGMNLKNMLEEKGYTVELKWADDDISRQVSDIEILIADSVDAIIVTPVDGSTLALVLNEAQDNNIPVIYYDRLVMNSRCEGYYISFDNFHVGYLQGAYIRDALELETAAEEGRKYNLEIMSGDLVDNNAHYFYEGAMSAIMEYIDSGVLNVVSGQISFLETTTDSWSTEKALNRMQNLLSSYYSDGTQLDAVLSAADCLTVGIVQAIEQDYTGTNTVITTGQDGDNANMRYIVDGKQSMTVYKCLSELAETTVALTEAILNGEETDESFAESVDAECTYDTTTYFDGIKYVNAFLLNPVTVTKDNIQEEMIDKGDYVWEDGYPVKTDKTGK